MDLGIMRKALIQFIISGFILVFGTFFFVILIILLNITFGFFIFLYILALAYFLFRLIYLSIIFKKNHRINQWIKYSKSDWGVALFYKMYAS